MKMTPTVFVGGSLLVWAASVSLMVVFPIVRMSDRPSDIWLPMNDVQKRGLDLYVNNGCSYCHSLYIRPNDWGVGASRIAQMGDYHQQRPAILGSERTGPDLSQEGGEHPDDWHMAHFSNPRNTSPLSLMPSWQFLGESRMRELTAYVQYLGGRNAADRVARQHSWKQPATRAFLSGPDSNIAWLHAQVPEVWRKMPNPYPATEDALLRGQRIYQDFCIGCHGPVGDGKGPAAPFLIPAPLNFTTLRRQVAGSGYIGGISYYQVMNGITGTAMPYFKKSLESEKIWDVSNYLAVSFIGYTDANREPHGIDAANEPNWQNPYPLPTPDPSRQPSPEP